MFSYRVIGRQITTRGFYPMRLIETLPRVSGLLEFGCEDICAEVGGSHDGRHLVVEQLLHLTLGDHTGNLLTAVALVESLHGKQVGRLVEVLVELLERVRQVEVGPPQLDDGNDALPAFLDAEPPAGTNLDDN